MTTTDSLLGALRARIDPALAMRFLAETINRGAALVVVPILARGLGAAGYGVVAQTQALVGALTPIAMLGLGYVLVRQCAGPTDRAANGDRLAQAFVGTLAASAVLAVAVFALAAPIAQALLAKPEVASIIRLSSPLIALAAIEGHLLEFIRARQRAGLSVLVQSLSGILLIASVGALALGDLLTMHSAVLALIATRCLIVMVSTVLVVATREAAPRFGWPGTGRTLNAIRLGVPFMLAGLAEQIGAVADRFVVGHHLGPAAVGAYAVAVLLASVLAILGAPFWWVLFPRLSAAVGRGDLTTAQGEGSRVVSRFIDLAVPTGITIVALGPVLIGLIGGPTMTVDRLSVFLLVVAVFANQGATAWEYFTYARSDGRAVLRLTLIWAVVGAALAWVLVPRFGLVGGAAALAFGRLALAIHMAHIARRLGFTARLMEPGGLVAVVLAAAVSGAAAWAFVDGKLGGVVVSSDATVLSVTAVTIGASYFSVRWLVTRVTRRVRRRQ